MYVLIILKCMLIYRHVNMYIGVRKVMYEMMVICVFTGM